MITYKPISLKIQNGKFRRFLSNYDWFLLLLISVLSGIGLIVLYSAGYNANINQSPTMNRQLVSMGIGFFVFFIVSFIKSSFWKRFTFPLYGGGCLLLILILIYGKIAGGSQRWLDLGFIRVQPSEFMKVGLILALARVFSLDSAPRDGYDLKSLFLPSIIILIPFSLILVEPDLGTALCHILIGGTMLLIYKIKPKTLITIFFIAMALAPIFWITSEDYQKKRILTFMSPETDPLGTGYHAIQSKIAVGSGELTGKGFMQGTQTQLRFLPEQTTDFVFSVLAEEWGFLGSFVVLSLYALLIFHLFFIGIKANDKFISFVSYGVAAFIFWHMVVNIGMVVGVLPVVGLTLPLLSYGGSSIVSFMFCLGLTAGFSFRRFMFFS